MYEGQAASFAKEARFKVFKALLDLRTTGMTQELPGLNTGIGTSSGNALANAMLSDVEITNVSNVIADLYIAV